ncbi:MAG: hypothetical protein AABZ80_05435, partial [Gemmatimonadota bacterium]
MTPYMFLGGFAMVCSVPVLIAAMVLISRHISQRRLSLSATERDEIVRRLDRIELGVDAAMVEIERVAEANRFVAK